MERFPVCNCKTFLSGPACPVHGKKPHLNYVHLEKIVYSQKYVDAQDARIRELEGILKEWIKPCFCDNRGTCLMCETRKILLKTR